MFIFLNNKFLICVYLRSSVDNNFFRLSFASFATKISHQF